VLLPPGVCISATGCLYYCHRVSVLLPPGVCTTALGVCTSATGCLYYCHRVSVLLPPGVCTSATGCLYYCHLVSTQLKLTNISNIRRAGTRDLYTPSKVRAVDIKVSKFFCKEILRSETYLFLFSARSWSLLICLY
jgi:hypothetical protein